MNLEALIYEADDDLTISKALKKEIKHYLNTVNTEKSGKTFFVQHTKKMDYFITLIFKYVLKKMFDYYRPSINTLPIALVALGSYGREQLAIYSDIDILIAYKETKGYNAKEIIENFITMLWDVGLKVGHRVHTVEDIYPVSKEDITIKTSLLESRFIYGSKFLYTEVENALNLVKKDNKKGYILAKYEEMQIRQTKYPISMEPDIKNGFGGLRDANTLFWIAGVIYNIPNNSYLVDILYSEEEYKEYRSALEFLFQVRVSLHTIAKKKLDTVLLQYQRDIALQLGYKDLTRIPAERSFSKDLLKSLWKINTFTSIYIHLLMRPYLYDAKNISLFKKQRISKFYYLKGSCFYTSSHNSDKFSIFFEKLITYEYDHVNNSVLLHLKQKKFTQNRRLFKQMFYKEKLYPLIKVLYKAHLLSKIIPSFRKIKYLAQFDGYHQYPVDIHSLKTIKHLESITHPLILSLYESFTHDQKALMKLTTLFHDLGKGRVIDHHIVGQKLLKSYAENLGFKSDLIDIGVKLVKYHTSLSGIAQREDIYNDKTILGFANIVENKTFLDMLLVLTFADVKAVGNHIYTSHKETLFLALYENTLEALDSKDLISEVKLRQRREKQLAKEASFQALPSLWKKRVLNSPSNQLFLQNTPERIMDIICMVRETKTYLTQIKNDDVLKIRITKKESENFNMGWVLGKVSRLNISKLSIYKIFDIKFFYIEFDEPILEEEIAFLQYEIDFAFKSTKKSKYKRPTFKRDELEINCQHSKNYISLKVTTKNQRGIIAFITEVLDEYGIEIEDVKAITQKKLIRDIFIIHKHSGFCEKYEEILSRLTNTVL